MTRYTEQAQQKNNEAGDNTHVEATYGLPNKFWPGFIEVLGENWWISSGQ
jgi:hypothetical protein